MLIKKALCTLCVAWVGSVALAHDAVPGSGPVAAKAPVSDVQAIEQSMKHQFDKPGAPLRVMPVSVEGDFAVAGWTQNERGGRALLQREHGQWRIALCGGDGLIGAEALAQSGLTPAAAQRLAGAIRLAEARMPAAQRKKLSLFEGVVTVGAGHNAHHPDLPAAKH
jgi:hypothetical protein